jgi:hypothetical protein
MGDMNSIVEGIIRRVERGKVFDAHYVIEKIIREHTDEYLVFAADNLPSSNNKVEYVHSQIARIIASFNNNLVRRMPYDSISYNIHGRESECSLWERLDTNW